MESLVERQISSLPGPPSKRMGVARAAAGREQSRAMADALGVVQVQRDNVHQVTAALRRVTHQPKVAKMLLAALQAPTHTCVWIWGTHGLAIAETMELALEGRIAWLAWLQNEPGFTLRKLTVIAEEWARQQQCTRIASAVDREGPWTRLSGGYVPWKLIIAKEL